MEPAKITLSYVEKLANSFLANFHPSLTLPIPIKEIVELKLNVRIVLINGLIRNFAVNAFINQKFDSIVIDEAMYTRQPERIRFTIAEEIGHLFLHKGWCAQHGPKGIEDYLEWQEDLDAKLFDYIERQAKTFAGMVLMPQVVLDKRWKLFAKQYSISVPCSVYYLPDTFLELAETFEVSPDSLLVRLSFLKLVNVPVGFWNKVGRRK